MPVSASDRCERSAYHDLAVALYCDRIDRPTDNRRKTRIVCPGGRQPGKKRARLPVDIAEIAADQNFSIRLHRDGSDRVIRTGAWIEAQVERTVGIEARQIDPVGPVHSGKK